MRWRLVCESLLITLIAGSVGGTALAVGAWALQQRHVQQTISTWQSVPCVIDEHWLDDRHDGHPPLRHLRYRYDWGGTVENGSQYSLAPDAPLAGDLDPGVRAFPTEAHAVCLVDPADPSHAILVGPSPFPDVLLIGLMCLALVLGVPALLLSVIALIGTVAAAIGGTANPSPVAAVRAPQPQWTTSAQGASTPAGWRLRATDQAPWPYRLGRWLGAVARGRPRPARMTVRYRGAAPRPGEPLAISWQAGPVSAGIEHLTLALVVREEATSTDQTVTTHQLARIPIGHDARGQATITIPPDAPPSWAGRHHQMSWAIEAESRTAGMIHHWRFPLQVESPARLQVAPTHCLAEADLAVACSLRLAKAVAVVAPGEALAGTIAWTLPHAPQAIALRLVWRCRSAVTGESGEERVVASSRLDQPSAVGRSGFSLCLPGTPLSWHGAFADVAWRIEAWADDRCFAALDLTVVALTALDR